MSVKDNLLLAIKNNDHDAVARLISQINPKEEIENNRTPIQLAADLKHWSCVEVIAKNVKANSEDEGRYGFALIRAVEFNQLDTAKILLEANAIRNWDTLPEQDTYLHLAIRNKNKSMLALLLSFASDIDLNQTNKAGKTPLQLAADLGYWDYAELILRDKKAGATDKEGWTLIKAVRDNQLDITKRLLEVNASSRQMTIERLYDTCFQLAFQNNNKAMIALFLSFGCDLNQKNNAGQTPIELADSLNTTCLNDGLKMYYNAERLQLINTLIVFAQATRQPSSKSYKSLNPDFAMTMILPFLMSRETIITRDTVSLGKESLVRASARCFIDKYPNGMFKRHSPASKTLVAELKSTLQDNPTTANIGKVIGKFLIDNQGKKTGTLNLLRKYKLEPTTQSSKDEKKEMATTGTVIPGENNVNGKKSSGNNYLQLIDFNEEEIAATGIGLKK